MTEPSRRRATNADRDALVSLHQRAIRAAGSDPADVPGSYLDDVEGTFDAAGGVLYVLEADGAVVAMGGLVPADDAEETAELVRIAVDPEHHRRGLGDRVVAALEAFARDAGFERVELETTERQVSARRLYESRGYVETGRREIEGYTVVGFTKRL